MSTSNLPINIWDAEIVTSYYQRGYICSNFVRGHVCTLHIYLYLFLKEMLDRPAEILYISAFRLVVFVVRIYFALQANFCFQSLALCRKLIDTKTFPIFLSSNFLCSKLCHTNVHAIFSTTLVVLFVQNLPVQKLISPSRRRMWLSLNSAVLKWRRLNN